MAIAPAAMAMATTISTIAKATKELESAHLIGQTGRYAYLRLAAEVFHALAVVEMQEAQTRAGNFQLWWAMVRIGVWD